LLERLARDKHCSLLQKFVNYGNKTFYRIGLWFSGLHTFSKLIGQNWVYFKFFFYASTSYLNILIGMPITYPKWRLDTHYDDTGIMLLILMGIIATLRIKDTLHKRQ
jgi:hypothetical protein